MVSLDDMQALAQVDPEDMGRRIDEMPEELERAWRYTQEFELPEQHRNVKSVVVLGMGGSAIGADLVRGLVGAECTAAIKVNRDYHLPGHVGPDTLVIASSYSGGTEETLSGYAEARERGAKLLAITTGGKLAAQARADGTPLLTFSYNSQPRAAVAHSLAPILGIVQKLGLVGDYSAAVRQAVTALQAQRNLMRRETPTDRNPAKLLAQALQGKTPVIYGGDFLSVVARRWKTQVNENSKGWAFYEEFPELNHNAVVGYENPTSAAQQLAVVFLTSGYVNSRVRERERVTSELLARRGVSAHVVEGQGEGPLAHMVTALQTGDYVSYYLALLYGCDPTPVKAIDYLKSELAKS